MDSRNGDDNYHDDGVLPMTPGVQILSAIGLSILILIGIGGNVFIVLAHVNDRHFNTVYDFFIFNLALTDLLLCSISMPFYAVYTLMEFTWPFGYSFCKVWLIIDFTLCFESILLMLILSVDRLLMVSFGLTYTSKATQTVAAVTVAVSWTISFLVYGPAIIGWNHMVGYSTVDNKDCDVEFAYDNKYTAATSIVEFILPFVCLTSLNALIYYKIRRRIKVRPAGNTGNTANTANTISPEMHVQPSTHNEVNTDPQHEATTSQQVKDDGDGKYINNENDKRNVTDAQSSQSQCTKEVNHMDMANRQKRKCLQAKHDTSNSRYQGHANAAKFLTIQVVAFLICWGPYTVTTIAISFCDDCINTSLYEFFNWLLWMKSAVNPCLYAFNSPRYRKHIMKYLTWNWRLCSSVDSQEETTLTSARL